MNPRIRSRMPPSIGSNQDSPVNKAAACAVVLSSSMAWSPPARQRRSWLVEQAGDYASFQFHHLRDGTSRDVKYAVPPSLKAHGRNGTYEAGLKQRGDSILWLDEAAIAGWQAPQRTTPGGKPGTRTGNSGHSRSGS